MGEGRPWAWLALDTGNPENMSAHKVWLMLKMMLPSSADPELPCARH